MNRFFKSAFFPILIVVVLAYFAQQLISPGEQRPDPSYSDFLAQVDRRQGPQGHAQHEEQQDRR